MEIKSRILVVRNLPDTRIRNRGFLAREIVYIVTIEQLVTEFEVIISETIIAKTEGTNFFFFNFVSFFFTAYPVKLDIMC